MVNISLWSRVRVIAEERTSNVARVEFEDDILGYVDKADLMNILYRVELN
jgi:hypothetical protein